MTLVAGHGGLSEHASVDVRLFAIPASHPCAAVAAMLDAKGVAYNRVDLYPAFSRVWLRGGYPRPIRRLDDGGLGFDTPRNVKPQVVGRDEPLAALDRFIEGIAERPASLTIAGAAGIGKTTVWQAGVEAAEARGYRVLASRPSNAEATLAYSGLADLLAHVDRRHVDTLPQPQRRALDIALLIAEPTGHGLESRAIFAGLGGVLTSLARETPVLIAIDDEQWLDKSSLKALDYVSRRLGEAAVGILTTVRPALADSRPASRLNDAAVLGLGPLSPAALHRLIDAQVGVSLSRPTILRVHRATEGNPFFALELARTLVVAGMPGAAEPWPIPDDLRELVSVRVGRLPKSVRSTLLVAAASGRPTISGLGTSSARAAERAGVVTTGEHGAVRFAHPLFAGAVYETATAEERRSVHASLAAAAADLEERARHQALACSGIDAGVATQLDRAAAKARARGAPDLAAELEERAVALTPPVLIESVRARRLLAAQHHFHAGDLEHARALLRVLADPSEPGSGRADVLRLLAEVQYRLGDLEEALSLLREAIAAGDGDPASTAAGELDLVFVLFYSFGSFAEGRAAARRALAAAEELGDDSLLAGALAAAAGTDLLLGHGLDEAMLARALALEDFELPSAIERRPSMIAGHAFIHTDQLERARSVLTLLRERLVDHGEDSDLPELLAVLARVECLAGNLGEATQLADQGFALAQQAGSDSMGAYTKGMGALVDAHAGQADETRAAAAAAIELAGRSGLRIAAFWSSTALALLELSLGNDAEVITTLAHSIALVEENGLPEPTRCPFLPDAIEALVNLGDHARADRLTRTLEERGDELGRNSAIIAGARCRALVLAAQGDVAGALAGLDRTLERELDLPMPLELARTMIVRGQLQRRRKQKRAARDSLERALALCGEIGATLWAQRAQAELARVAVSPDRDVLTPTEARVAALAASGLTNREIAASAFLSQKTVEANLSRIYRKLGVRSRAELGLRLAAESATRSPQPGGG